MSLVLRAHWRWFLRAVGIVLFLGAVWMGVRFVKAEFTCGDEEAAVLHSLPGAAGRDLHVNVSGDCEVGLETAQSDQAFITAYGRRLRAHGWKVAENEVPSNTIDATRGGWQLSLVYEGEEAGIEGFRVSAYVWELEEQAR